MSAKNSNLNQQQKTITKIANLALTQITTITATENYDPNQQIKIH